LRSFQRNTQPVALTELQTVDVPLRVLVSEPDISSRRLVCALLQGNPGTTVICVEDSQLLSTIDEIAPDLVILDVHSLSIRQALSWEGLGIQPAPRRSSQASIPRTVSRFASNAVEFLVKPFDVDRLESALDLATTFIGKTRAAAVPADSLSDAEHRGAQRRFVQRLAVEAAKRSCS
jgi:DNA-binding NtrC family response regulator